MANGVNHRLVRMWRRFPFSVRFTAILSVTGLVIAGSSVFLARADEQATAQSQAAYGLSIATALVSGQRNSLDQFANEIAVTIQRDGVMGQPTRLNDVLLLESQSSAGDVVGLTSKGQATLARSNADVPSTSPLMASITAAATNQQTTFRGPDGEPWLLATVPVEAGGPDVVVARQLSSSNLPGIAIFKGGQVAGPGNLDGSAVAAGSTVPTDVANSAHGDQQPSVLNVAGKRIAVTSSSLGGGYTLLSTSIVTDTAQTSGELLLIALLLAAILVIVAVVQGDLQRPLRRLDRAVANLTVGSFETPIPQMGTDDEIGRLSASFENMRLQLQQTLRESRARAMIAGELNAPQPLQTALAKVCAEVRAVTDASATLLCVAGSEMTDAFVVGTGESQVLDVDALLEKDQPLGTLLRSAHSEPVDIDVTDESLGGEITLCGVVLGMGDRRLGVLAAIRARGELFSVAHHNLMLSTAEQVSLALERYRFIAMVQRQATMDDLTGLYNHRFMVDYVAQQVALAERLGTPLALLMVDLDHFKRLNDEHGHAAGDSALNAFALTLSKAVRRSDLAARYGGEEFVVVMPNTGLRDAARVAEKVRAAVAKRQVPIDSRGATVPITVSIGVAAFPENTTAAQELLQLADGALYLAKDGGRNRVVTATVRETVGAARRRGGTG